MSYDYPRDPYRQGPRDLPGYQEPTESSVPVRRIALIGVGALAGFVALCVLLATTWVSVDSSHATIVYNGGLLDSRGYDQVVGPGSSKKLVGISQNSWEAPVGLRQYRISNDQGSGADYNGTVPVTVRGINMRFEPTILFTLSTVPGADGKPAVADFYEKHLRQFHATDFDSEDPASHWVTFLNTRVYPVVKSVMQTKLTGQDPVALRFDTDGARSKAADELGAAISDEVEAQLGGRFFCGPNYSFGQPAEACGSMSVQLTEPEVDDNVREMLEAPQRATVEADNKIAAAQQATRQATGVAAEAEAQVAAAQRKAAADKATADAQAAPVAADAGNNVAPCRSLGETDALKCALLLQALKGQPLPSVGGAIVTGG